MKISKTMRRLWYLLVAMVVVSQAIIFLRLRAQRVQFFHSTREILLLVALAAVMLVGILAKSKKGNRLGAPRKSMSVIACLRQLTGIGAQFRRSF
jgi:hypothetical protein